MPAGIGDGRSCSSGSVLGAILLEKGLARGFHRDHAAVSTGLAMANDWSVPEYRFLDIPYPIANLSAAELEPRAEDVVGAAIDFLLKGQPGGDGYAEPVAIPAG